MFNQQHAWHKVAWNYAKRSCLSEGQNYPLSQFITADHFDPTELLLQVCVSSMVSRELYINSSGGLTAQKAWS